MARARTVVAVPSSVEAGSSGEHGLSLAMPDGGEEAVFAVDWDGRVVAAARCGR